MDVPEGFDLLRYQRFTELQDKCKEHIPKYIVFTCSLEYIDGHLNDKFKVCLKRNIMKRRLMILQIQLFNTDQEKLMFQQIDHFVDISLHGLAASAILNRLEECGHTLRIEISSATNKLEVNQFNKKELMQRIREYNY